MALTASMMTAVAGLALVSSSGAASNRSGAVRGGSGVITTFGVGLHRFEVARPAGIRAFAGKPDSVQYENRVGNPSGRRGAVWEIWTYRFSGGRYVYYSFHRTRGGSWLFVEIETNRTQFETARGTRVGMSYAEAKKREDVPYIGGCPDSGFWHFRDQHRYAVAVGVNPGHSVYDLDASGPHRPIC
jgi:hypothetical protein